MKLAEALINRADAQKRIQQLRERLNRSAVVQEGEQPPENPQDLLVELDEVIRTLTTLIKRINRTNSQSRFSDEWTLTDALAERDALSTRRGVLTGLINSANVANNFRYSRSEIKQVATVDIGALQKQVDDISRRYREIDSEIQRLNWSIDLIED